MSVKPANANEYDDLTEVGATATAIATFGGAKGWDKLLANKKLKSLKVVYLSRAQADVLSRFKHLESLHIFNGDVRTLDALTKLNRLKHLKIESTGYLRDFAFLGELKGLRTLKLGDVSRLKDFSLLENLPRLQTFEFTRVASWVVLPTLASFAKLKQLRALHLNYDAKDGSLAPLAELTNLQELSLPLTYGLEEYARLAVARPDLKCDCLARPYGHSQSVFFKCKRCGGLERITLARGQRGLCPKCDAEKFQAYLKRYEALKAGFKAKVGRKSRK